METAAARARLFRTTIIHTRKTMKMTKPLSTLLVCATAAAAAGIVYAQASGLKRELVMKADVSVPNREAVVARVEVAPGILAGRHTHPGDEISYVLEGEGELLIDGEPPRKLKAGDAFVIPAGKIHDAKNTGSVPMKLVGTYVVEKGKPLASPAPAAESK
jgi:quercetin dioxygenase-like cupin family protein